MATPHGLCREEVRDKIQRAFGIKPCLWQVDAAIAQLEGKDMIVTAPIGMGKTL
jgi:ATP-dependent helicase YprA (DUF1998 family)